MDRFLLLVSLLTAVYVSGVTAQTEGDTGYDDGDVYDIEYGEGVSVLGKEPSFDTPLANVTAQIGSTAILPCAIDNIGKYKVAWLEEHSIPLTYEDRRVIDDSRFSIVRSLIRDWNLQIQEVRLEDRGQYRCTLNTKPVSNKVVSLLVNVPAVIDEQQSSGDVTAQEGTDVTMTCSAFGVPTPEITWYRLPHAGRTSETEGKECAALQSTSKLIAPGYGWSRDIPLARGPLLSLRNISRYCSDLFECRASNGATSGPASHRVKLTVEFAPLIRLDNRRIGQSRGRQTILECSVTAFPQANNYWQKDGRRITSSNKHKIEAYEYDDNTVTLSLRILDLDASDYGLYTCVASNPVGADEQNMTLFVCKYRNGRFESSTFRLANIFYTENVHCLENEYPEHFIHPSATTPRTQRDVTGLQSPPHQSEQQRGVIFDVMHSLPASVRAMAKMSSSNAFKLQQRFKTLSCALCLYFLFVDLLAPSATLVPMRTVPH